jgi:hypothetical protein
MVADSFEGGRQGLETFIAQYPNWNGFQQKMIANPEWWERCCDIVAKQKGYTIPWKNNEKK